MPSINRVLLKPTRSSEEIVMCLLLREAWSQLIVDLATIAPAPLTTLPGPLVN